MLFNMLFALTSVSNIMGILKSTLMLQSEEGKFKVTSKYMDNLY